MLPQSGAAKITPSFLIIDELKSLFLVHEIKSHTKV